MHLAQRDDLDTETAEFVYLLPSTRQFLISFGVICIVMIVLTSIAFWQRSRHSPILQNRPTVITLLCSLAALIACVANIEMAYYQSRITSCVLIPPAYSIVCTLMGCSSFGRIRHFYRHYRFHAERAQMSIQDMTRENLTDVSPREISEWKDAFFWKFLAGLVVLACVNDLLILFLSPTYGLSGNERCVQALIFLKPEYAFSWAIMVITYGLVLAWLYHSRAYNDVLGIKADHYINMAGVALVVLIYQIYDLVLWQHHHEWYQQLPPMTLATIASISMHCLSIMLPLWMSYTVSQRINALFKRFLGLIHSQAAEDLVISKKDYQKALRSREFAGKFKICASRMFAVESVSFLLDMIRILDIVQPIPSSSVQKISRRLRSLSSMSQRYADCITQQESTMTMRPRTSTTDDLYEDCLQIINAYFRVRAYMELNLPAQISNEVIQSFDALQRGTDISSSIMNIFRDAIKATSKIVYDNIWPRFAISLSQEEITALNNTSDVPIRYWL
ncbi:hypothetical protein SeMB42_g04936 [Synchytrium endobioticum]|uniref:RGS domain-containing protein n=1 Tax=Synchytrium endobioticum TaxID=286115 RepID=A0A507CRB4_9FUNG|nr:hypothetical protein SeLEV6574_g06011 [Synchytrium endobioticum]TPX42923.1 hypothetical protein SeMB42_g04936 [Synchytrium endobioticum]